MFGPEIGANTMADCSKIPTQASHAAVPIRNVACCLSDSLRVAGSQIAGRKPTRFSADTAKNGGFNHHKKCVLPCFTNKQINLNIIVINPVQSPLFVENQIWNELF